MYINSSTARSDHFPHSTQSTFVISSGVWYVGEKMATQYANTGGYYGHRKEEAVPYFSPRTSLPRPISDSTDIMEDFDNDDSDEFDLPDDSPFTSVASFGSASVSTASTPDEAHTPESTGLTLFDFHIDEKAVRGPNGPHLFRSFVDSSIYNQDTDIDLTAEDRPPSTMVPFYQSASKLDPVRRDTPVPNRATPTPQPQQQRDSSSTKGDFTPMESEARNWTPQHVVRWLQICGFDNGVLETFFYNDISGSILLELQTQDLKELGIQSFGKRHMLMGAIKGLLSRARTTNVEVPYQPDTGPIPPTPRTFTTTTSGSVSSSNSDGKGSDRRAVNSRRRRHHSNDKVTKETTLAPEDPVSIVAIEQVLPKLHSCSKGENCRKWQKQQARLAHLAKDLPIESSNGRIIVRGDPGNPKTAPNLRSPKSDITPSLVASSDVMGPARKPEYQLSMDKLNEVQPRDPQENVRNFISFQKLSKLQPVNEPGTPPKETIRSPESSSLGSAKGNPTLSENLRHLPRLQIPRADDRDSGDYTANLSSQRTVTPSITRKKPYFDDEYPTAIPQGQQYAYGVAASPGDFYRVDPHYSQSTPLSEMDVPMTAFPISLVSREDSQSVPPNMRFGADRLVFDPIFRPGSTKGTRHRRNTSHHNFPTLCSLDERRAVNPIETPEDMERTPRVNRGKNHLLSPTRCSANDNDITQSGWMKKRKTTRLMRHEWEDHHFTLQGTQLAMHTDEDSARRHSKALEYIDVDDYAVACSSLASSSKLTAAFKKTVLKRKDNIASDSAFGFSLIPATGSGSNTIDKKALFLHSGKPHHFAVKTRDERIDWMRELMLAKALKRGRESGAAMNVNGNFI
ncbi:hypothetical protein EYZ11_004848 [Aspergillus tanneri]|uniref:SAM and PH domain protein n=1 Tax=Aspergillus tanneri TaxID=1220188 RepID=A0A4S3JQB9_9EURO|nr:hypothetical protein EYZ11_004848 [Aspergillus tanneri]